MKSCIMCGAEFPEGTPAARKYCLDCGAIKYKQDQQRRNERKRERKRARKAQEQNLKPPHDPKTLQEIDKRYCGKCVYAGSFSANYLCNFMLMTGERRGCKAGVGCNRRLLEKDLPKDTRCVCERCGKRFEGSKWRRFCDDCRKELQRQAGRHMAELKKEQKK